MAKKNKKDRPPRKSQEVLRKQLPEEDRRSIAVTVAWMMATLATGAAMVFSTVAYALHRPAENAAETSYSLGALAGLLHFIGFVTGVLALALIPAVYRVRPTPPPLSVTVVSAVIGFAPLLVLLFRRYLA